MDSSDDEDNLYANYWGPEASRASADGQEGYDLMHKLQEVSGLSDNKDLEAGDFSWDYLDPLDEGRVSLVEDVDEEAYTSTFNCAMLVNATGTAEGVKTELYRL